ncbi:MAG TPA: dTMP kinase, partial [Firmicutes bacterium]|nr:dTMP kinase [Bacillota bacterium]
LMLYLASRAQLVAEVVRPALAAGSVVISDRYADSSVAYQGYGRELGVDVVRQSNALATGNLQPDLTLVIDIPVEITKERMNGKTADRLESEKRSFHERIRNGFLEIARDEPERVVVVDGTKSPDDVHLEIVRIVSIRFPELTSG